MVLEREHGWKTLHPRRGFRRTDVHVFGPGRTITWIEAELRIPVREALLAATARRRREDRARFPRLWKEKPVSDDVFRAYKGLYVYDKGELNARVEETLSTADWTREKITFNAAYGGERVVAYLYLPKNASPPFQTVVYFPGSNVIFQDRFDEAQAYIWTSFPRAAARCFSRLQEHL